MECRHFQIRLGILATFSLSVAACSRLTTPTAPPPNRPERAAAGTNSRNAADDADSNAASASDRTPLDPRLVIKPYYEWSGSDSAADALGRIGPAAVPQLIQLLSDPDPQVRSVASRVLARIGPDAVGAVPDLIKLLEDDHEQVRRAAARALGQIGPNAAEAVPSLVRLLEQVENDENLPQSEPDGP